MNFDALTISPQVTRRNHRIESALNRVVRFVDRATGLIGFGRKAAYDDHGYEFIGGPSDKMRTCHYDKSLRLLWKAETHAPWSDFKDCNKEELALIELAEGALDSAEREHVERMRSAEFKELLNREYTPEQKQAIVNILSLIGHGEAYAWLVSAELLNEVKSTGARSALTMQVLEEAKHFVVLRQLIQAFDMPVPRMCAYEYVLLERTFKSKGMEKFFGMNVVVEGFALSLFGMMSHLPGLELLRLFHLDESRHTALPMSYFAEFPMSKWRRYSPTAQLRRLSLVLPALPILTWIENDLAVLGIDAFEFGGSLARKVFFLADRAGFKLVLTQPQLHRLVGWLFNQYCRLTRPGHERRDWLKSDTTRGIEERKVEDEVFAA